MRADAIVAEKVHMQMFRQKVKNRHLADAMGISEQSLGKKINGRSTFSLDELLFVSRYLGVPLVELLPDETYEPVPLGGRRPGAVAAGGGATFLPIESWCAIRDLNPEPADSEREGRLLSIVGRIPLGERNPIRPIPGTRPTLRLIGGAA